MPLQSWQNVNTMKSPIVLTLMLVTASLGLLAVDPAAADPVRCDATPDPTTEETRTTCYAGPCYVDYDALKPSVIGCYCAGVGLHGAVGTCYDP